MTTRAHLTRTLPLALALLALRSADAAVLTRGPYLQLLGTRSVTIVWNTDVPVACAVSVRPLDGTATVIAGATGTVCAVPLAGLTPGAHYAYGPLAGGAPLRAESVFQADDPTLPYAFIVFGDSGGGGPRQYALRDAMAATRADMMVHVGDMVYERGAAADFDPKLFTPYADFMRRMMLWPCLGNHDFATGSGQPWRDAFYTPANNPARNENYYSFDFGNAHFVVLNTDGNTSPGSAQYTFLDQDLAASTATWKFVVFHYPPYSSGTPGTNVAVQTNLVPLLDRHAVDIVFAGHDHDYERTLPLRGGVVTAPGAGTIYVVTGGGGESILPVGASPFTAYAESIFHFVRVAVQDGGLRLQMIREDGRVADTLTLAKPGPGLPAPSCGDGFVNQPAEICDGLDRPACRGACAADCTCLHVCGDGRRSAPTEACDGLDDAACPGLCLSTCQCGPPARFVTVAPIADTYIESGAQATWDHGAATQIEVDGSPADVGYLKFDLSAVGAPIARATLIAACTNGSPDGGAVYPVGDSSWAEGDRTGADASSAGGPGLKWSDVDSNADGVLDASDASPWRPDFGRWYGSFGMVEPGDVRTIDVTSALQGGTTRYSFAIRNDTTNGADYASRNHADPLLRPRLRLELAEVATTTTTTVVTTTTMATTTTRPTTTTTRPATTTTTVAITTTTTLAPAVAVIEADVTVRERQPGNNFGTNGLLEASNRAGRRMRSLVRVRVAGIGARTVTRARLRLQVGAGGDADSDNGGRIRGISSCTWNERTVTWSNQPALDGSVLASIGRVASGDVVFFDVTPAVTRDGTYCFALDSSSSDQVQYNSREGSAQRPAFVVEVR
jgi:hypothetical protein